MNPGGFNTLSATSKVLMPDVASFTPISWSLPRIVRCESCFKPFQGDAFSLFCTDCAKSLERSNPTLAQCCGCGMMLNGHQAGERMLTRDGTPDLTKAESHGYCASCADAALAAFRTAGRQRRRVAIR